MNRTLFIYVLSAVTLLLVCHNEARPGKISGGGGRRGGSGGSRGGGSTHTSWTSWQSKPSTHTGSNSGNVALSYPSKPKPSAPDISHAGSHSYPASHGSSGGSHSYPASSGASGGTGGYQPYVPGGGAGHSYPSNTGLSGNTGHITNTNVKPNYNSPGGSNPAYPASGGLSGSHSNPAYPAGSGLSGHATNTNVKPNYNTAQGHSYPGSTGLSGGNKPSYPAGASSGGHATNTNARPNYNAPPPYSPGGYQPYSHNQPPPPYSPGGYHAPSYGQPSYGGYHGAPTYYGGVAGPPNYPSFSPSYQPVYVSRSSGPGIGTAAITGVLSGLAAYNLARAFSGSGSHSNNQHVYHHYDKNKNEPPAPAVSAKELSNCTLSVADEKGNTNILLIPCEIATSFAPDTPKTNASVSPVPVNSSTKETCTISVTRDGKKEETTVPCDFLTNMSKNVTQPPDPPRISCAENPQGGNNDANFTPCKFVDVIGDEEYLKVIPLRGDDNKIEGAGAGGATHEETKVITESILMDPAEVRVITTSPSA